MARETQGLQIALIVFVMLSIVLGVTTFIFFGRYDEALVNLKKEQTTAKEAESKHTNVLGESNRLKEFIGIATTEPLTSVEKQFNADMEKYAGAFLEDQRHYRPLIEQLFKTINERDRALAAKEEQLTQVKAARDALEAEKKGEITKYMAAAEGARKEMDKDKATFKTDRDRMTADQKQVAALLDKARKDAQDSLAKVQSEVEKISGKFDKERQARTQLAKKLDAVTKEVADTPLGEIRWVDQKGTVWINLGRADSLGRQISFSVYSPSATDLSKAGRKACIEVTQITGDHLAEARIIEDKPSDPIMPGDKIFTPVWRPGDKQRFALAGLMDINGDGKSDIQIVRNLITMNGGVVDCESGDKGDEVVGEITANTTWYVVGKEPKSDAALTAWSKMNGSADRLNIKRISLEDLLRKMGYKDLNPVVRYGQGANPNDFKARAPEGAPRVSTGNTTSAFTPRNPPRSGNN